MIWNGCVGPLAPVRGEGNGDCTWEVINVSRLRVRKLVDDRHGNGLSNGRADGRERVGKGPQ